MSRCVSRLRSLSFFRFPFSLLRSFSVPIASARTIQTRTKQHTTITPAASFSSSPSSSPSVSSSVPVSDPSLVGEVSTVSKGLVHLFGLNGARQGDLIQITRNGNASPVGYAVVLTLNSTSVVSGLLGGSVEAGDSAASLGPIAFPVSLTQLGGRVIDPIGRPLDDKGSLSALPTAPVLSAPSVPLTSRDSSRDLLPSGIKQIDFLRPVAKGLRIALTGSRHSGKSHTAADFLIFSLSLGSIDHGVYVLIGKSKSELKWIQNKFESTGVADRVTIVFASNEASQMEIYLAPFSGCTLADQFRDAGKQALIVYDDLASHGNCCLTLNTALGYPLFSANSSHAKLLERSARLRNGGSSTALCLIDMSNEGKTPQIAEALAGFVDHSVHFDSNLAAKRRWPAINCNALIGRPAARYRTGLTRELVQQIFQQLSESEKLASQYRWAAEFGLEPEEEDTNVLEYRDKIQILLEQSNPQPLEHQYLVMQAAALNYLAPISMDSIYGFEKAMVQHFESNDKDLMEQMRSACKNPNEAFPYVLREQIKEKVDLFCDQWRRKHGA